MHFKLRPSGYYSTFEIQRVRHTQQVWPAKNCEESASSALLVGKASSLLLSFCRKLGFHSLSAMNRSSRIVSRLREGFFPRTGSFPSLCSRAPTIFSRTGEANFLPPPAPIHQSSLHCHPPHISSQPCLPGLLSLKTSTPLAGTISGRILPSPGKRIVSPPLSWPLLVLLLPRIALS